MAFTFFFRDEHVLDLLTKHLVNHIAGCSRPRIWDAGCAMGPEPYTLALMLSENMGKFAYRNLRILATDIDESGQFGEIIQAGVYPWEMLARIPSAIFQRYFQPCQPEGSFKIDDEVRSRLEFKRHDLLSFKPAGEGFSLILCKNVLLHFTQEQRIEVIRMFHQALSPGGFFATEQTQKLPPELQNHFQQVTADAQIFIKREVAA